MQAFQPNFPFAPRRVPFFYGWVVVVASTLGMMASIPGQTMGVSVFTDHLIEAMGVSRLALSNTYLVGTVLSGLLLPVAGVAVDRFGVRVTAVAASLLLAATLGFLSTVDRVGRAAARIVAMDESALPSVVLLVLGFTALRFSGQGILMLTSRTMLGKWFDRRRGLVTGIGGIFVSFAFGVAPMLFSGLITAAGWRGAWATLAVSVGGGMAMVAWLLFRDNPEECGLRMDGMAPRRSGTAVAEDTSGTSEQPGIGASEPAFTRGEALRTSAFWTVTLALALHGMNVTGITFHIVDLGLESGLQEQAVVQLFLPMAVIGTVVQIIVGVVSDRVSIKWLIVVMMLFEALGVACTGHLGDPAIRAAAVAALGCASGFFGPLSTVALPRFFGRLHLGAIGGAQMTTMVLATAAGPTLFAVARQEIGGYRPALWVCVVLTTGVLLVALRSRRPERTHRG